MTSGCHVTKISSCWVKTTSRRGIKQLAISFSAMFLVFSYESSLGHSSYTVVTWGNPRPAPLNNSSVTKKEYWGENCFWKSD